MLRVWGIVLIGAISMGAAACASAPTATNEAVGMNVAADAYCDAVAAGKEQDTKLREGLESGDPTKMATALQEAKAASQKVLAAAPADVKPVWQAQVDAIGELESAVSEAAQAMGDPAKLQQAKDKIMDARTKLTESKAKGEAELKTRCS